VLARKSALIVLNAVVGGALGFVALKVVALYMGAGIYGQLAYATSLVGLVMFLGNMGFTKAHAKRVSEGEDVGDCVATLTAWNGAIASIYILIVLGAFAANELFLGQDLFSTTQTTVLLVTLAEAAFFMRKVARSTFEARVEAALSESVVFFEHIVRTPIMAAGALLYASSQGREGPIFGWLRANAPGLTDIVAEYAPETLAFAVTAAAVVSMTVGFVLLLQRVKPGDFSMKMVRSYAEFGLPVFGASSFNSLQQYHDKAALGFFWSDAVAGRYFGFQRLFSFLEAVYAAVRSMLFPMISERHAEGDREGVRRLSRESLRYLSMISVPAAFGATALAEPLIRIMLSEDWLPAVEVFIALAFVYPLRGIVQTLTQIQYGSDEPKMSAGISMFGSTMNVVVGLLLIPSSVLGFQLGGLAGLGAAAGTLVALVLDAGARAYTLQFPLGRRVWLSWLRHWIAGGLMAYVVYRASLAIGEVRWFILPALIALGGAVYFALLWVFRDFGKDDAMVFWAAVHPGEMASYVKDEVLLDDG
jgi:O-antigen/teichoic acid export membrane protein